MSQLRALHSTGDWLPQTQTWLYNQVRFLPPDVETDVVCESVHNLAQYPHPRLHVLQREPRHVYLAERAARKLRSSRYFDYWPRVARRTDAQIVHSHFGPGGWSDAQWVRQTELKHIVSFYGYDISYLPRQEPQWQERYQEMFASVDRVLCEGRFMASSIEALGCPAGKVRVQRLGIDTSAIRYEPRSLKPGEPLRILAASSFREKKGLPYALEAVASLARDFEVEMTIIGDSDGSPSGDQEKARIMETIQRHGMEKLVHLTGFLPHSQLIERAYGHHIFLAPSLSAADGDSEGGAPVVLIEMAASGMPVVSTRHCDIPEIIQHQSTGLLADERDTEGLYEALRYLAENPDAWNGFTSAARAHIETNLNAVTQGEMLANIYRELCSS